MANSKPAIPPTRTKRKGFLGIARNAAATFTGTLSGTETAGIASGSGPAISRGAGLWGNGTAPVFGN
jgi:transcription elongation factor